MKVRLLAPHWINARYWEAGEIVDVELVSPLMEGLDNESIYKIYDEKRRVFGRPMWDPEALEWYLLDDPPIEHAFLNPPVLPLPGTGGPGR